MECTCKFYELDLEKQKETEELFSSLPFYDDLPNNDSSYSENEEDDPLSACEPYCKYLRYEEGYGECVHYCCAVENEHVIKSEINESEVLAYH